MSVPFRVDDGDFKLAWVNGTPKIEYPFLHEADNFTWEWTATLRMDAGAFRNQLLAAYQFNGVTYEVAYADVNQNPNLLSVWQTPLGQGYLLDMGTITDVGSGLYEFTVTVGRLPVNRIVGRTLTYTYQFRVDFAILATFTPPSTTAQVLTEYSLTPLPILNPPTIQANALAQILAFGDWNTYSFTKNGSVLPPSIGPIFGANVGITANPIQPIGTTWQAGDIIVAQTSKNDIYKGGIYYRETWFVTQIGYQTLS